MKKLHGAWPAMLSPKAADGGVDVAALRGLVDYLLGLGADGLYVGGSTGEGVHMSLKVKLPGTGYYAQCARRAGGSSKGYVCRCAWVVRCANYPSCSTPRYQ